MAEDWGKPVKDSGEWGTPVATEPTAQLSKAVAAYPPSFQNSPEAIRARGEQPPDFSQSGLTGRLWKGLTGGLVSPETVAGGGENLQRLEEEAEANERAGKPRGLSGMGASAARVVSGQTSPVALGLMATGPLGRVPGAIGEAAKVVQAGTSIPVAVQGAGGIVGAGTENSPEAWEQRLQGGAQLAGGSAGIAENAPLIARGSGAAMETTGRLARMPIGELKYKGLAATPANLAGAALGGIGGGYLGHMTGVPEAGYVGATVGGIGGAATADALAKGVERLGSGLRQMGGYEPEPVQRDLSTLKSKAFSRITKSRVIPDMRDAKPNVSPLPALGNTIPDLRDVAPKVSHLPAQGRMIQDMRDVAAEAPKKPVSHGPGLPATRMIPRLEGEQPRILLVGEPESTSPIQRVIQPGNPSKGLAEIRSHYGGDPWTWPKQVRQDALDMDDPDMRRLAPAMGMSKTGTPTLQQLRNAPRGY